MRNQLIELDYLIIYAIALNRSNKALISDIMDEVERLWKVHNITFPKSKLKTPSYHYFYARLNKLIDKGYVERQGKRTYRINRDNYDVIIEYIKSHIKFTYGLE